MCPLRFTFFLNVVFSNQSAPVTVSRFKKLKSKINTPTIMNFKFIVKSHNKRGEEFLEIFFLKILFLRQLL